MGGPNLEVFKFGMYIMFPIGIMYYFGTNLDARFAVPDFWPKEGQTHTIPFEKDEIKGELERLKQRRLAARARRLAMESLDGKDGELKAYQDEERRRFGEGVVEARGLEVEKKEVGASKSWWNVFGR